MRRATQKMMLGAAGVLLAGLVVAAQEPAPSKGTGPTLTNEEILAYQSKDDVKGDAAAGRPHYVKLCANCHVFGGIGLQVGPDLSTLASRFKKADVLDSILYPSKVISDQYQSEMVELADGTVISGVPVRESAAVLVLRTAEAPEKPVSVPKGKIKERAISPVSLMPDGLVNTLTQQQIADLLAFLLAPAPAK